MLLSRDWRSNDGWMLSNSSSCQELEPLHVPGHMAGVSHDLMSGMGAMNPALLIEVAVVREWQRRRGLLEDLPRKLDGALPLGWKCPLSGAASWA